MMKFQRLALLFALLLSVPAFAQNKKNSLPQDYDRDEETLACMTPDDSNADPSWDVFEKAIPICKRAILSLQTGARLDLGQKKIMKTMKTGIIIVRARVVSGNGVYDISGRYKKINPGVEMWMSFDRCQVRRALLEDDKGRSVEDLASSRFVVLTEDMSGIANGDQFPDYKNSCR